MRDRQTSCRHSSRCRVNCSSSSTRHRSDTSRARYGYRSGCAEMCKMPPTPPPLEARAILGLNFIRHYNARAFCTKYLQFFDPSTSLRIIPSPSRNEVSAHITLSEILTADILDIWILDSVAESQEEFYGRQHIHLLPFSTISYLCKNLALRRRIGIGLSVKCKEPKFKAS